MRTRLLHQLHELHLHAPPAAHADHHDAAPRRHVRQDAGQAGRADQLEHDVVRRLRALVARRQHHVGARARPPPRAGAGSRTVAVTRAPACAASCTAAVPTPPAAPETRTRSPICSSAWRKRAS